MASKHIIRPFNGKVTATGKRLSYLEETFHYLEKAAGSVSTLFAGLGSYLDATTISNLIKKNQDLAVVVFRYHVVPKGEAHTLPVGTDMVSRFVADYGMEPNEFQRAYLDSPIDQEKYCWQDNRDVGSWLAEQLGVTDCDMKAIAVTFYNNQMLYDCVKGTGSGNAVSLLFGSGKKSDYSMKGVIAGKAASVLVKYRPATYQDARKMILEANGFISVKDLVTSYGVTGRSSALQIFMEGIESGPISSKTLDARIKKFTEDSERNGRKNLVPHAEAIRNWLIEQSGSGVENYQMAWCEVYGNVAADWNAKVESNFNFAEEKVKALTELSNIQKSTPDLGKALKLFEEYLATCQDEFVIAPYHFSVLEEVRMEMVLGREFNDAYSVALDNMDMESKQPIQPLCKFLIEDGGGISFETFRSAAKYVKTQSKIAGRYPHPFVTGNQGFTFGPKNIWSAINDPMMEYADGRIAGGSAMMWVTATLLDGGKWVRHHIPFANTRYFEEVYASKKGLPVLPCARDGKHSFKLGNNLSAERVEKVKEGGRTKATKAQERILSNVSHNVQFDSSTTFIIRRQEESFVICVNHRHPAPLMKKEMEVGDKIIGIDQNQTAPTTYAIVERIESGGIERNGKQYKVTAMGAISSVQKTRGGEVDVLSYMGVELSDSKNGFQSLWNKCLDFVTKHGTENDVKYYNNTAVWANKLYVWHKMYFRLLKQLMRRAKDLKPFRDHLQHLLFHPNLSPLQRHSLSLTSLEATKIVRNCIHSYFSLLGLKTLDERKAADINLLEVLEKLYSGLVERRKERTKLTAGLLIRLCNEHGISFAAIEGDLPVVGEGKSKAANNTQQDWTAKELEKRFSEMAEVVGIKVIAVLPHYTSHQDPFVYSKNTKKMRCRWNWRTTKTFTDRDALSIRRILSKPETGTNLYYQKGLKAFAEKHGLDLAEMKKRKDAQWYLERIQDKNFLVPMNGGRVYLSSVKLAGKETIDMGGEILYLNDADQVAALNVLLVKI
jgi:hypothetical protein